MKKIRKAIIPAAGYGTRLLPITKVVPKELLPIGNKPAIQYVVEEAVAAGIEEIILVCHPSKTAIVDYFRPDKAFRAFLEKKGKRGEVAELEWIESMARFEVVYQESPLGLGHAIWCARKEIRDEPFLVMLPDILIDDTLPAARYLIESCEGDVEWGLLLKQISRSEASSYGVVRGETWGKNGFWVTGAVEKPRLQDVPSDLGILGRYLLPPDIMEILEGTKAGALGEIQLTDAIDALAQVKPGMGVLQRGEIFDIGIPEGFREAREHYEEASRNPARKTRGLRSA